MKWILGFSSIFFIQLFFSTAGALEVIQNEGRIYLQSQKCAAIESELQLLQDWTVKLNPDKGCHFSKDEVRGQNFCQYDITECVPDHVQKYQGKNSYFPGPNCWNLALVMNGILPALRFTSQKEAAFYFHSPLCHQLAKKDVKQAGDIGAIRSKDDKGELEEVHAFVYVSDQLAYSKNGAWRVASYELMSLKDLLNFYDVPPEEECSNLQQKNKACDTSLTYFRCTPMPQFMKSLEDIPLFILNFIKEIEVFEKALQDRTLNGYILPEDRIAIFIQSVNDFILSLENDIKLKKVDPSENKKLLLQSIEYRISSIKDQLGYTKDRKWESQLGKRQKRIQRDLRFFQEKK